MLRRRDRSDERLSARPHLETPTARPRLSNCRPGCLGCPGPDSSVSAFTHRAHREDRGPVGGILGEVDGSIKGGAVRVCDGMWLGPFAVGR
jgi:hypothetical protein